VSDEELQEALSVSDDHPVMRAMLHILDSQAMDEVMSAVLPGLSSEDRAYNCGRAASIKDLSDRIGLLRSGKRLT
jgi:hypothetical protein